jgi:hypothetical protein
MDRRKFWFGRKNFGLGIGPISWQGWLLGAAYLVVMMVLRSVLSEQAFKTALIVVSVAAVAVVLWKFDRRR